MRKLLFLFAVATLLVIACGTRADERQAFLPGIYTRVSDHEFGKEWDTVVISLQNSAAEEYLIVRRWRYERVLDGQRLEPEYKVVGTAGFYDSETGLLEESESRFTYSFDIERKTLFAGTAEYKKLK